MEIDACNDELFVTVTPWFLGRDGFIGRLEVEGQVTIGKAFKVTRADVMEGLEENDVEIVVRVGIRQGEYWKLDSKILSISYDLYLSTNETWKRKHFVAEKGVSIFPKLNSIISGSI